MNILPVRIELPFTILLVKPFLRSVTVELPARCRVSLRLPLAGYDPGGPWPEMVQLGVTFFYKPAIEHATSG